MSAFKPKKRPKNIAKVPYPMEAHRKKDEFMDGVTFLLYCWPRVIVRGKRMESVIPNRKNSN